MCSGRWLNAITQTSIAVCVCTIACEPPHRASAGEGEQSSSSPPRDDVAGSSTTQLPPNGPDRPDRPDRPASTSSPPSVQPDSEAGASDADEQAVPMGLFCIVPVGDSITQADALRMSYRYWLWETLTTNGWNVDFVGSMSEHHEGTPQYPNPDFDRDHEGHWGWTADSLLRELPAWLQDYTPSLAIVHAGTNDNFGGQPVDQTLEEVRQIIDVLRADNPQVVVLLAELIPAADNDHSEFNAALPGMGEELSTDESPVVVVNVPGEFDAATDLYDGVHPNESGERKMAATFAAALEPLLIGGQVTPCE